MSQAADYYAVIGVDPSASAEDIRKAYRAGAKLHHPDAGGSPAAMDALNEAYAILGDPSRRREYDTERQVEAEVQFADVVPPPEAEAMYQDMTSLMKAEVYRQQAAQLHAEREAWARQSAIGILGSSVLWLGLSLILGYLLRPEATVSAVLTWAIINAGILLVGGYGLTATIWPEHRLEIYDLALHRRILPSALWWKRSTIILLSALIGSGGIVLANALLP